MTSSEDREEPRLTVGQIKEQIAAEHLGWNVDPDLDENQPPPDYPGGATEESTRSLERVAGHLSGSAPDLAIAQNPLAGRLLELADLGAAAPTNTFLLREAIGLGLLGPEAAEGSGTAPRGPLPDESTQQQAGP